MTDVDTIETLAGSWSVRRTSPARRISLVRDGDGIGQLVAGQHRVGGGRGREDQVDLTLDGDVEGELGGVARRIGRRRGDVLPRAPCPPQSET